MLLLSGIQGLCFEWEHLPRSSRCILLLLRTILLLISISFSPSSKTNGKKDSINWPKTVKSMQVWLSSLLSSNCKQSLWWGILWTASGAKVLLEHKMLCLCSHSWFYSINTLNSQLRQLIKKTTICSSEMHKSKCRTKRPNLRSSNHSPKFPLSLHQAGRFQVLESIHYPHQWSNSKDKQIKRKKMANY